MRFILAAVFASVSLGPTAVTEVRASSAGRFYYRPGSSYHHGGPRYFYSGPRHFTRPHPSPFASPFYGQSPWRFVPRSHATPLRPHRFDSRFRGFDDRRFDSRHDRFRASPHHRFHGRFHQHGRPDRGFDHGRFRSPTLRYRAPFRSW